MRRADADDDAQDGRQRRDDDAMSEATAEPEFLPAILEISQLVVVDRFLSVPKKEAEDGDGDGLQALEAGVDHDDDVTDDLTEPEVGKPLRV